MREVVVDASAFVKGLIDEPGSDRVIEIESAAHLMAPSHLLVETANVLWKKVRWSGLGREQAMERLEQARRFDIELVPDEQMLPHALGLACELPHPLYDTLYLLLALHGGRPLATADARMREAAEALGVRVEWVGAAGWAG